MIIAVSSSPATAGTVLTIDRALTVPADPSNQGTNGMAQIWVDTLVGAVRIPAQTAWSSQTPLDTDAGPPAQPAPDGGVPQIISQGMRSSTGDIFSQGMMAQSGPWAGQVYSQGMEMPGGDVYSKECRLRSPRRPISKGPRLRHCHRHHRRLPRPAATA